MLLRAIFCVVCLASVTTARAQWADLLRNPEVTWVAEYTTDYLMDLEGEEDYAYEDKPNYIDLLQFINTDNEHDLYGRNLQPSKYLSQQLLNAARDTQFQCFKDSSCRQELSTTERYHSLTKLDTAIGCCDCPLSEMYRIRFVQNWYYDERRQRLYCRLVGLAPLATIRDVEGQFRFFKPLFYQMYR